MPHHGVANGAICHKVLKLSLGRWESPLVKKLEPKWLHCHGSLFIIRLGWRCLGQTKFCFGPNISPWLCLSRSAFPVVLADPPNLSAKGPGKQITLRGCPQTPGLRCFGDVAVWGGGNPTPPFFQLRVEMFVGALSHLPQTFSTPAPNHFFQIMESKMMKMNFIWTGPMG